MTTHPDLLVDPPPSQSLADIPVPLASNLGLALTSVSPLLKSSPSHQQQQQQQQQQDMLTGSPRASIGLGFGHAGGAEGMRMVKTESVGSTSAGGSAIRPSSSSINRPFLTHPSASASNGAGSVHSSPRIASPRVRTSPYRNGNGVAEHTYVDGSMRTGSLIGNGSPVASPTGTGTGTGIARPQAAVHPDPVDATQAAGLEIRPASTSLFNLLWSPTESHSGGGGGPASASPPNGDSRPGTGAMGMLTGAGGQEDEPLLPPPVSGAVTAFGIPAGAGTSPPLPTRGSGESSTGGGGGGQTTSGAGLSLPSLTSLGGLAPPSTAGIPPWAGSTDSSRTDGLGYLPRPSVPLYRYSSSGSSSALDDPLYRSTSFSSSSTSFTGSGPNSYYGSASRPSLLPVESSESLLDSSDGGRFSRLGLRSGASSADTGVTSWRDESERGEGYNVKRRRSDEGPGIPEAQPTAPNRKPDLKARGKALSDGATMISPLKKLSLPSANSDGYIDATKPLSGRPPRNGGPPQSLTGLPAGAPSTVTALGHKRKHVCTWVGCGKGFTTSGHLARHHRIHTGEKRYECLMPGCTSRFSRQDNMLQHYRTHLSGKSRRVSSLALPIEPSHAAAAQARLQAHQAKLDADDVSSASGSSSGGGGGGGGIKKAKSLGRPPSYAWEGQPYGLVFDDPEALASAGEQMGSDRTGKMSPPQQYYQVPPGYTYQPPPTTQMIPPPPTVAPNGTMPPPPSTGPWLQAVSDSQHDSLRRYAAYGGPTSEAAAAAYPTSVPGSYGGIASGMSMNNGAPQIHHHFHHHYNPRSASMSDSNGAGATVPPSETFRSRSYDYSMPPPRAPASFMSSSSYHGSDNGNGAGAGAGGYGGPASSWRLSSGASTASSGSSPPSKAMPLNPEVGASLASYRAALAGHHLQEKVVALKRQKSFQTPGSYTSD